MSFKKMRLLEEDEYLRMKDKQIKEYDPELRTLTLLKSEITDLLSNDSLDANEKQKLLNRAQIRFDNLRNLQVAKPEQPHEQQVAEIKVVPNDIAHEEIPDEKSQPDVEEEQKEPLVTEAKISDAYIANRVDAFDTNLQPRVRHLLMEIQKIPNISFDEEMRPVIGNLTLYKSNFDDIINFIINPIGRAPPGYVTFTKHLKSNNIVFEPSPPGTSPTILKVYS